MGSRKKAQIVWRAVRPPGLAAGAISFWRVMSCYITSSEGTCQTDLDPKMMGLRLKLNPCGNQRDDPRLRVSHEGTKARNPWRTPLTRIFQPRMGTDGHG